MCRGLGRNLKLGVIKKIHLVKLRISREGWMALSDGIGASKTLKSLLINLCTMNHQAFEELAPGLKTNTTLEVLDLAYN